MLAKYVDKVMVGFEESRQHYPHPERVVVTGTPVRGEFFNCTREEARAKLGFAAGDTKPVVVTSWGSLGARGDEPITWWISLSGSAGRAPRSTTSTA